MSRYPEFDLSHVKPQPFRHRISKVRVESFARPPKPGASFLEFLDSLPGILAGPDIRRIADAAVQARANGRAVIIALGGHVIKTGLAPVLIRLMERGAITALAGNGAVAIHDIEIGLFGETSEAVELGLQSGTFGMARETAAFHNTAVAEGARRGEGAGEALGRALMESNAPHAGASLLASAYRLNVPITIHMALGADIVHIHPDADPSALGEATMRDFRILTHQMGSLAGGGVLLNVGSAVVLPEVLLKAIALLRNRHGDAFTEFLGVNLDFVQHYRSNQQVVARVRTIGGDGISLTGHHELMVPLLAQTIIELLDGAPRGVRAAPRSK